MGRKTLENAKEIGALGGKARWAKISPAERSRRMKAVRKGKKSV